MKVGLACNRYLKYHSPNLNFNTYIWPRKLKDGQNNLEWLVSPQTKEDHVPKSSPFENIKLIENKYKN